MSKHEFKFEIGQLVKVENVECIILDRDICDDLPDYLCKPIDEKQMVLGQWELGAGWVRDYNITAQYGEFYE